MAQPSDAGDSPTERYGQAPPPGYPARSEQSTQAAPRSPYGNAPYPKPGYQPQSYTPPPPMPSAGNPYGVPPGPTPNPYAGRSYPPPSYSTHSYSYVEPADRGAPNTVMLVIAWVIAAFTFFYMVPWAVAVSRNRPNQGEIGVLNLLLGWSGIGWVVTLVMACSSKGEKYLNRVVVVDSHPQDGGQPPPAPRR